MYECTLTTYIYMYTYMYMYVHFTSYTTNRWNHWMPLSCNFVWHYISYGNRSVVWARIQWNLLLTRQTRDWSGFRTIQQPLRMPNRGKYLSLWISFVRCCCKSALSWQRALQRDWHSCGQRSRGVESHRHALQGHRQASFPLLALIDRWRHAGDDECRRRFDVMSLICVWPHHRLPKQACGRRHFFVAAHTARRWCFETNVVSRSWLHCPMASTVTDALARAGLNFFVNMVFVLKCFYYGR